MLTRVVYSCAQVGCDSLAKIRNTKPCWQGCRADQVDGLPVCHPHAFAIYDLVRDSLGLFDDAPVPTVQRKQFVYYLMIAPHTVKIGYTSNLAQRVSALRSELQYVVGLETGGQKLERQRHLQFAVERNGRREDFRLSDRLKSHIESLQSSRDTLIALATK